MSDTTHSMTDLIQQLQDGKSIAARELWNRCLGELVRQAKRKLKGLPRRVVDEEDVALAAFEAFLRGAQEKRFEKLENRDDLWQILAMLTERRAIAVIRKELAQKRGGGRVRGESVFEHQVGDESFAQGIGQVGDPSPLLVDVFTLEVRELLEKLDDDLLRRVALGKLEGYENRELGQQLGIAERTVERKLQLIRRQWQGEREL